MHEHTQNASDWVVPGTGTHRTPVAIVAMAVIVVTSTIGWAAQPQKADGVEVQNESRWRTELLQSLPAQRTASSRVSSQSDAAGGCDGAKNGGFGFHTNQDNSPWWHVDLGAVTKLDRVVIYNRCSVSDRAAKLHVLLSDDAKKWTTVYRHNGTVFFGHTDGKPLVVPIKNAASRFVRIQVPIKTWLHLDEVEVYASAAPKKNIALGKPADQSSSSSYSPAKPKKRQIKRDVAVSMDAYVAAVRTVLSKGRLLSTDLKDSGLDSADFERSATAIDTALKELQANSLEFKTHGLYLQARRAVRDLALANPVLDFDRVLLVRRSAKNLGLPANWQSNSSLRPTGFDNEIAVLSDFREGGKLTTLFRPEGGRYVGEVDLHFDATKMLFSMPDDKGRWQVFELGSDGKKLRQFKLIDEPDVGNYDACYLPGLPGDIIFSSTAPFIGVPCVRGSSKVTNLYRLDVASGNIRRLTFDQEHNWCPTVLNDGRLMYLRWEYTDLPHSNSRILFHMNTDGTNQQELYGSNSYWPNGTFYARPVPGHPSKVAGIISGHHGVRRMGELILFDPAASRREADGVVQRIPGYGKPVEPIIRDGLVNSSWPRFLHPYPLSENYLLVSCKPTPSSNWGLYLVDVFDNMILLAEQDGYAMLEPIPFRPTSKPPAIASKVDPERTDATVQLVDIYRGGMAGIPRGTVKKLRLFTYEYSFHGTGGLLGVVGADGPWDIRRMLGTVPVKKDGSAVFRIPANTPIAVQPLDEDGQALQMMRSWFVGMPGEVVSCVGCHEKQDGTSPLTAGLTQVHKPDEIEPWYGPVRGFSFKREVQPVIDRHCVGCHSPEAGERFDVQTMPDLRDVPIKGWRSQHKGNGGGDSGKFSVAYHELARYVRRSGIESNMRQLTPMEFHASTTELVQMLRKGHHGVRLDKQAWDRVITWIDLNAPYHGTWTEIVGAARVSKQAARRRELMKRYAGVDVDEEAICPTATAKVEPLLPDLPPKKPALKVTCKDWPFDKTEAERRQRASGKFERTIQLADGVDLKLVLIPAGQFVMGDAKGHEDEQPLSRVRIDKPYWMGRFEITNEQFAQFDPTHDSRVESKHGYQFGVHGYPVNGASQPVVRVSWLRAMAFCQWLSKRADDTGLEFTLPTEAQWEYACRAGTDSAFHYGDLDTDFSKFANLGDAKLKELAGDPYTPDTPMKNPNRFDDWVPKDTRFNDGALVSINVGTYAPNAWGLYDIHGNVAEWTRSSLRPYPWNGADGRNDVSNRELKVVRGGSWYDRPKRCRSSFRIAYRPYQPVYNVGFRVVAHEVTKRTAAKR